MALQVQVPLTTPSSSVRSWTPKHSVVCASGGGDHRTSVGVASRAVFAGGERRREKIGVKGLIVRSSLDTAGPVVAVGQVTEVNKDTFWPLVKAAGDKAVVVDMYTQWYVNLLRGRK